MSKVYKGYELLKAIADGEIKENIRFRDDYNTYIYEDCGGGKVLYKEYDHTTPDYSYFACNDNDFELIEEDTIDIQSIEEFDIENKIYAEIATKYRINDLIKAVKQLDKKLNDK